MKIYFYWRADKYADAGGRVVVSEFGGLAETIPDYLLLGEKDVDFVMPEIDARGHLAESLRAEKAEILREATQKAAKIEERIQQLLALPSSVAA